jgi:hypothetical protein
MGCGGRQIRRRQLERQFVLALSDLCLFLIEFVGDDGLVVCGLDRCCGLHF